MHFFPGVSEVAVSCFCPRASLRCSKNTRARAHCEAVLAVGREKKTPVESEIEDETVEIVETGDIVENVEVHGWISHPPPHRRVILAPPAEINIAGGTPNRSRII